MLLPDSDAFLDKILSFVRFPFDRPAIRAELENHIEDKTQQYIESGVEKEAAEKQAVIDMGDAKEIGVALNKEHSPLIGWLWRLTRIAAVLCAFALGVCLISSLFIKDPADYFKKENIVYQIKVNKTAQVDNTVIKITDVIYTNDGEMHILYDSYNKWLQVSQTNILGTIEDDLGNTYPSGGGRATGNDIRTRGVANVENFNTDANMLIIDYDQYDRQYRIEIPLEEGKSHEN